MTDITIIGCGVATQSFVKELRRLGVKQSITIIDSSRFYRAPREILNSPEKALERLDCENWAKENKASFLEARVERVNFKRRKIYLKNQEPQEFTKLIVATGLVSKKSDLKGDHRQGFFYLSALKGDALLDTLKMVQEAVVQFETSLGLQWAFALNRLDKETRLVCEGGSFLGEITEHLISTLKGKGITLESGFTIEEAVGESMVKACKLKPLKVVSAQMVVVDKGLEPNRRFIEDEYSLCNNFFCEHENVFFLGDVTSSVENQQYFFHNHDNAVTCGLHLAHYFSSNTVGDFVLKNIDTAEIQQFNSRVLCLS